MLDPKKIEDIARQIGASIPPKFREVADDVEATQSITQATLTEGAIGYRRFDVIAGHKAMVTIRMANHRAPPHMPCVQRVVLRFCADSRWIE